MTIFTFPRNIYFKRGAIEGLQDIVSGSERQLVITDANILKFHGDRIKKSLQGKNFKVYSNVSPEPTIESVENAFRENLSYNPDTIIAIGGGSVIDFAKSVAIKFSYPDKDLREIDPFKPMNIKVKMIAVPTTSGTGSDVSLGIVLTDGNRKIALGNYSLVPDVSILDSTLTPNVKDIIRSTGIDAFVHCFEALSARTSTILTDALTEKSIDTIYHNLKKAMENNEEAKDLLHLAATMAGMAFSNSGTALAHALGHSFGSTFHVVHGTSVGLLLPYVIEFNSKDEKTNAKYKRVERMLDMTNIIDGIEAFYEEVGQPYRVKDLGISADLYYSKIDEATEKALMDKELYYNPIKVGKEDIKKIFLEAYGD